MGHALDSQFHAFYRADQFALRFPDVLRFAAFLPCHRAAVSHGMVRRVARNADSSCIRHPHGRKPVAKPSKFGTDREYAAYRGRRGAIPDFAAGRNPWLHAAAVAVFSVPHRIHADVFGSGGMGEADVFRALHGTTTREQESACMTAISIPRVPAAKTGVELTPGMAKFVALVSAMAVVAHLVLRFLTSASKLWAEMPLYGALALGGAPLVVVLTRKLVAREFGSDFLAGVSIVTAVLLREYLVATIVVLMLSGGTALETFATRRASRVLEMLAKRMPAIAHRKTAEAIK